MADSTQEKVRKATAALTRQLKEMKNIRFDNDGWHEIVPDVDAAHLRTLLSAYTRMEERVKPLADAAQLVIDQTNHIHETDPPPIKYRAPYGAIANLTRALAAFYNKGEE